MCKTTIIGFPTYIVRKIKLGMCYGTIVVASKLEYCTSQVLSLWLSLTHTSKSYNILGGQVINNFITREGKVRDHHHHHHHPRLAPCAFVLFANICDITRWSDSNFHNEGVFALCGGFTSTIISCADNKNGKKKNREQHHSAMGL
jgi:hypothetical protein